MSTLLLLNDWSIRLYQGSQLISQDPAYISLANGELVFGESALQQCRLHPQQSNNQYLERLNTEPLSRPLGPANHHADLLYQQFRHLADQVSDSCVIAVPASIVPQQLGLILGISQEAGIHTRAFVDRAVLGTLTMDVPNIFWHLDLQLHRACLTEVEITSDGKFLKRKSSEDIANSGIAAALEGWVNVVADQFVQQSRFDPLHTAATEQQLYDQIVAWAKKPEATAQFRIVQDNSDRHISVDSTQLYEKLAGRLQPLLSRLPSDSTLVVSDTCAHWPGLSATLQQRVRRVLVEPDHAVATNFQNVEASLKASDQISLKTQLPYRGAEISLETTRIHPTHAYYQGFADPLEGLPGIVITQTDQGPTAISSSADVKINGNYETPPFALSLGDNLVIGDRTYELIRVRN